MFNISIIFETLNINIFFLKRQVNFDFFKSTSLKQLELLIVVEYSCMNKYRDQILLSATKQFFELGFTRTTTEKIVSEIGVSKKTVYKYFPSKLCLFQQVVDMKIEEITIGTEEILQETHSDFIQKIKSILAYYGEQKIQCFGEPFLQDTYRKAPGIWKQLEIFRDKNIYHGLIELINDGINNGTIRKDICPELVVLLYVNAIKTIEALPEPATKKSEIIATVITIILEGTLTNTLR